MRLATIRTPDGHRAVRVDGAVATEISPEVATDVGALLAHADWRELAAAADGHTHQWGCLLYTSPSPRDGLLSRMPSSA